MGAACSSIYQGIKVQGNYVAYLMAALRTDAQKTSVIQSIVKTVNENVTAEIRYLEWALLCLASWLVIYIFWWTLTPKTGAEGSK
jgi:hypothetical protein